VAAAASAAAAFVARAGSSAQLRRIATDDDDVSVPTNVRIRVAGRSSHHIRAESHWRERSQVAVAKIPFRNRRNGKKSTVAVRLCN